MTATRLIIDEAHQFLTFISSYCHILNLLIHRAGKTLAAIKRLLMSSSGSVWVHKQSKVLLNRCHWAEVCFFVAALITVYLSHMLTDGAGLSALSARLYKAVLWGLSHHRRVQVALLKMDEGEAYASQRGGPHHIAAHMYTRWNSNKTKCPLHHRANNPQWPRESTWNVKQGTDGGQASNHQS